MDAGTSCATDVMGNVYLAGSTNSTSGIASGGFQNTIGGESDAFLVKFSPSGTRLWATYYGGEGTDAILPPYLNFGSASNYCAIDPSGNTYLSGSTNSTSGIASGGFQNTYGGGPHLLTGDAFLVKIKDSVYYELFVTTENSWLPKDTLWQGNMAQQADTLKICADGSTATAVTFINNTAIASANIRFRMASDLNANMPEAVHGKFVNYTISGDTIRAAYRHPTYLAENEGIFNADQVLIVNNSALQDTPVYSLPVKIYRAPIVMVHGLWSDRTAFESMYNNLNGYLYTDSLLYIKDYSNFGKNAYKFANNADVAPNAIRFIMHRCRTNGFSVGKVIYMGHSMGGLLGRQYIQSANYKKDIQKFITINTPHSGSQVANFLENKSASYPMIKSIFSTMGMEMLGATEDLRVNSTAIQNLNAYANSSNYDSVSCHAVTTTSQVILTGGTAATTLTILITRNLRIARGVYRTSLAVNNFMSELFNGEKHDLIVPLSSQKGGLSGNHTNNIAPQVHMGSPGNTSVRQQVTELIALSPDHPAFSLTGFNPPKLSSAYRPAPSSPPSARPTSGSVTIDAPLANQTYYPGQQVNIEVSSTGSIDRLLVMQRNGDYNISSSDSDVANATFIYTVPEDAIGRLIIVAVGGDSTGIVDFDTVSIEVEVTARLDSISFYPNPLYIAANSYEKINLTGWFDDSVSRSLNTIPSVQYEVIDTAIAGYISDNILKGLQEGVTDLMVSYKGQSALIPVIVLPEDGTNYLDPLTSIKPFAPQSYGSLLVYPNPNSGSFTLSIDVQAGENVVTEIYDVAGKKVWHGQERAQTTAYTRRIMLSDQPSGMYYIRCITDTKRYSGKVLLAR